MMNLLYRNCFIRFFSFLAMILVVLSFLCQTGSAQEKTAVEQPAAAAASLTKEIVGEKLAVARKKLAALSAQSPPQPPTATDKKGFESFNAGVDQQRDRVAAMRTTIGEHRKRLEALPELIAETRKESEAAEKNAALLAESGKSAKTETEKKLIDLRLENAQLEKQIALKSIKILTEETDLAADLEPVLTAELELAEKQLERLEQELELYSKAYEQQLALVQQQKVDSLARKEKEVATAKTPAARFIAEWDAELSRSEKNKGELEQF